MVVVTPWSVSGTVDYDKLIAQFGCVEISPDLIDRVEKLTGKRAHPLLRRGVFFAHRDLDIILDAYEKGERFYLYTGRGPSSEALHLGHLLQFMFTKYLQDAFDVSVIIQLSDDEKFLWSKDQDSQLEEYTTLGNLNAKDIIACGFNPDRTFIFLNSSYANKPFVQESMILLGSYLSCKEVSAVFGVKPTDSAGKFLYPVVQMAPSFSKFLPDVLGDEEIRCLVPCAIDQDPYFRLCRDLAASVGLPKPAVIESRFLPALQGDAGNVGKMCAGIPASAIFVTDTEDIIRMKVREISTPNAEAYLNFFMEEDCDLTSIKKTESYCEEALKDILCRVLWKIVEKHQVHRKGVSDEVLEHFMKARLIC